LKKVISVTFGLTQEEIDFINEFHIKCGVTKSSVLRFAVNLLMSIEKGGLIEGSGCTIKRKYS